MDPKGACNRAAKNLQKCLIEEGNRLAESGMFEQALTVLFRAYSLMPGVSPVLHDISAVYEAFGDNDSAMACRRSVIPETAEERYFNSKATATRIIAARKASNCRHIKTHKPVKQKLRAPKSNGNPIDRPEFRAKETESRGSFVSDLEDGRVWFDGFNTVIADRRGNFLKEHIKGNVHLVADVARQRPEQYMEATVCFIDARSSPIYYHWMIDVLPKLAIIQAAGIDLKSIDCFVVRCHSQFQKFTLNHLEVPAQKISAPSTDCFIRCKRLIVPFLKHDRGDRFYNGLGLGMAPWVPGWLSSCFVDSIASNHKKIYISRANRGTRSPVEEQTLIDALKLRGFESVSLETMTVVEQANLLAGAEIVVAPHGAGLSNIAFCQPETTIVEIFGNYVVPCYWALSELANLDYHAYFVNDKNGAAEPRSSTAAQTLSLSERRNQSIDLEIDEFLTYLDSLTTRESLALARLA
ncbi:MAG: DUF563 domain-containing protein [Granulosicoccus sp.]